MAASDRRAPLSRARILDAALALIDAEGLDALSMRRLGAALGVDPMAIYHHVPNKDALLVGVVEKVFAGMPAVEPVGSWQEQVRAWAHSYRDLARAHPGLVLRIVSDPAAVAVAVAGANEPLHRALAHSELPPALVAPVADVVVDFVHGAVLPEAGGVEEPDALSELRDSFELGLDLLVSGIELLAASPAARHRRT